MTDRPTARPPRTFLFLQGLASPFFRRLGGDLAARGFGVERINLNVGDRLFWRLPGGVDYRGRFENWRGFLSAFMDERGVTDLVLFGDGRPYHRVAIATAQLRGVDVHVFEEGYFRPNWITLEQGGVNGFSGLPRDPQTIRRLAAELPDHDPAVAHISGSMGLRSLWDVTYNVANVALPYLFPFYRRYRPQHPLVEYAGWLGRMAKGKAERRRAAEVEASLKTGEGRYFLLPLQLDSDYQIRLHSPFDGVRPFLEKVLASFAKGAPEGVRLLVKLHPLDPGYRHWRRTVTGIAEGLGLGDRVGFIDGGDLPALIAASRGVVVVNSTVGMLSLDMGRPTVALGTAIYAVPGLVHAGDLDGFWAAPTPPDAALMADFRRVVLNRTQVNGGFFSRESIDRAVTGAVFRLEAASPAPAADRAAAGAEVLSPA